MKRIGLIVLALVFAMGLSAQAGGVSTGDEASSAKKLTISGGFDNTMVSRDSGLTSVLDGCVTPVVQKSDFFWSPLITLNFGIDMGEKVTALVQLQNRRLDAAGGGTANNVDFLGGDNIELAVEQAYLNVEQFIDKNLTFKYGLQNVKLTLRNGEGAFFMDTNNSEILSIPYTEANVYRAAMLPKDTSEFGGMRLDYGSLKTSNWTASMFWGVVNESKTARADQRVTGLAGWYKLPGGDTRNYLTGGITKIFDETNKTDVQTINVGTQYFGSMPDLELYAEYYTQSGDLTATVSQDASAYRVGGHYDIKNDQFKPYVDVSYWFLSGGGSTTKSENFLSYENVQSTMILEDNIWGLDIDSNYTAIKVEAGLTYNKLDINKDGVAEPLTVKLLYGQFNLADKPATMTVGQVVSDSLGTEIDVTATLHLNKSVSFALGYGKLTGGDFFTSTGGYNADTGNMQLITLDAKLKF